MRRSRSLIALAAGSLGLLLVAGPAAAQEGGSTFTGDLQELNESGASGTVTVTASEDGSTVDVELTTQGTAAGFPHAQHFHAIVEDGSVTDGACPTLEQDSDGDGVITTAEGLPAYGAVQVSLTTEGDTSADSGLAVERFPTGEYTYTRSGIELPSELQGNLSSVQVVVHGVDENGDGELNADQEERSSLNDDLPREATLPALCGVLTAQASTVQTGAGGTATDDSDTTTLAVVTGLGLLALAGGVALRRRTERA